MILIGQYDSPFVRRVGIALHRYGLPFEHRPWSVWKDAEAIGQFNPLRRVPTLVLDDGTALLESASILEELDEMVGPERALLSRSGPMRREGLRISALAIGTADKAVSLLYERLLRDEPSATWMERCRLQIGDGLATLEADRARRETDWWLGDALTHADVAVSCMLRFTSEAHPGLFDDRRHPRLAAHAARCEELEEFRAVGQPFVNNLAR